MKRCVTVLLCAWVISAGGFLGVAATKGERAGCHPQMVRHDRCDAGWQMEPAAFDRLVEMVNGQTFDDGKFLVIEAASLGGWFDCRQAAALMSCFKWDDDKLKVLRFLVPRLVDSCGMESIFNQFSFDSSKEKAWGIISQPILE